MPATHTNGIPSASDRLTCSYARRKASFDSAFTTWSTFGV
jgi:hypothetical protein